MPIRRVPLVTGEYYHVFNRGINHSPTFMIDRDYQRAVQTLSYYRSISHKFKYSHFLAKSNSERSHLLLEQSDSNQLVTVIAYCLMPNHFHFLIKQETDGGISKYIANFENSYTKYFDAKHKRSGAIFNRQFKTVLIESENQLLHLTRYIHLNPFSAGLISKEEIQSYPYSSMHEYVSGNYSLANPSNIIDIYPARYLQFVLDNADYQQQLGKLKHIGIDIED